MNFIAPLIGSLLGLRILRKDKGFQKKLKTKLKRFRRAKTQQLKLTNWGWLTHVHSVLLIASVLGSVFVVKALYPWIHNAMLGNEALLFFNQGELLMTALLVILLPLLVDWLFQLFYLTIPSLSKYYTAKRLWELEWLSGQSKKPDLKQTKDLNRIAGEYDLHKASTLNLKNSSRILGTWLLITFPLLYFSVFSFTSINDMGVRTLGVFDFKTAHYNWEQVEGVTIEVEEQKDNLEPHIWLEFKDGQQVDIWTFGLLFTPTEDLLAAIQLADDHNIFILKRSLPDISQLRSKLQDQIRDVYEF